MKSARKISGYSLEECKKKIKGCDASFDTRSKDLINHFVHLSQIEWEGARNLYPKYQRLYDKYSYPLQKSLPSELDISKNESYIESLKSQVNSEEVYREEDDTRQKVQPVKEIDDAEKDI